MILGMGSHCGRMVPKQCIQRFSSASYDFKIMVTDELHLFGGSGSWGGGGGGMSHVLVARKIAL